MSIYKKAKYRIIITKNGKYLSTIYRCQRKNSAFSQFNKLKNENKKNILFPKKFINNSNGVKPVEFKILVVKVTEPNDEFRLLKDKLGRIYTEEPLGVFTILEDDEYNFEETFWVYGVETKKYTERPTIKDILKKLSIGAYKKDMSKQVIVVYNKLIIHNEEQFDMVLCKNREDAHRLHMELYKAAHRIKIKSLVFMGIAKSKAVLSKLYELIQLKTGWKYSKIRRYTNC